MNSPNPSSLDWLFEFDWIASIKGLIGILCLVFLLFVLFEVIEKVLKKIGISTAKQREHEENVKHINENYESIVELERITESTSTALKEIAPFVNEINQNLNDIKNDVNELNNSMSKINTRVKTIEKKQQENDNKNREIEKAKLKDRMYQAYRYYRHRSEESGRKEWTKIEKDGFYSMLRSYEMYDNNSMVHTKVLPYMEDFVVISLDDNDDV